MGLTLKIKRRELDLEVTTGVLVKKLALKNRGSLYSESRESDLRTIVGMLLLLKMQGNK